MPWHRPCAPQVWLQTWQFNGLCAALRPILLPRSPCGTRPSRTPS